MVGRHRARARHRRRCHSAPGAADQSPRRSPPGAPAPATSWSRSRRRRHLRGAAAPTRSPGSPRTRCQAPGCGCTPTSTATWPATTAASGPHRRRHDERSGIDRVRRLAAEAVEAGVTELILTGGEPFLLPDIDDLVSRLHRGAANHAADQRDAVHAVAGWSALRRMDRTRLDPADQSRLPHAGPARPAPGHRLVGRAVAGIRTAQAKGSGSGSRPPCRTSRPMRSDRSTPSSTSWALPPRTRSSAPSRTAVSPRGHRTDGRDADPGGHRHRDGVYWHPVGADHEDQLVTRDIFPLDGHQRGPAAVRRLPRTSRRRGAMVLLRVAGFPRRVATGLD